MPVFIVVIAPAAAAVPFLPFIIPVAGKLRIDRLKPPHKRLILKSFKREDEPLRQQARTARKRSWWAYWTIGIQSTYDPLPRTFLSHHPDPTANPKFDEHIHIGVIGPQGVGKTTLTSFLRLVFDALAEELTLTDRNLHLEGLREHIDDLLGDSDKVVELVTQMHTDANGNAPTHAPDPRKPTPHFIGRLVIWDFAGFGTSLQPVESFVKRAGIRRLSAVAVVVGDTVDGDVIKVLDDMWRNYIHCAVVRTRADHVLQDQLAHLRAKHTPSSRQQPGSNDHRRAILMAPACTSQGSDAATTDIDLARESVASPHQQPNLTDSSEWVRGEIGKLRAGLRDNFHLDEIGHEPFVVNGFPGNEPGRCCNTFDLGDFIWYIFGTAYVAHVDSTHAQPMP